MKNKLYALFAFTGLLSLGAFSSCTTYVDPVDSVGPAATTTTTVDPYAGTTQRTVTTRY